MHDSPTTHRVMKVGGSRLDDDAFVRTLASEVGSTNQKTIVVHGGGPQIGALHDALDVTYAKRRGLRVTTERGMEIVAMVLGRLNQHLVGAFGAAGLRSLGVSGVDARLMRSDLYDALQLGRVGTPPRVNLATLRAFLSEVDVLVVSPVCLGPDHAPVNVNADDVAQQVACALRSEVFDMMTDVDAVRGAEGDPLTRLTVTQARALVDTGVARGGMAPKLLAACDALEGGVECVRIGTLESIGAGRCTAVRRRPLRTSRPPARPHLRLVAR